jgi:SAM-dependent methyltransferase
MDRMRYSAIGHTAFSILNPVGSEALDRLIECSALPPGARVLDIGCGKGEALIRMAARFEARGIGIEPNPAFLRDARAAAASRGVSGRLEWFEREWAAFRAEPESFDAALCIGASHAIGDYRAMLEALRGLVRPGGRALVGHGYWKRPPAPEYLASFGGSEDELTEEPRNVAIAGELGLGLLGREFASDEDWDRYEGGYAESLERFGSEHPDDPDVPAMLERIRGWRAGYLRWGRETMGFALYLFERRA